MLRAQFGPPAMFHLLPCHIANTSPKGRDVIQQWVSQATAVLKEH